MKAENPLLKQKAIQEFQLYIKPSILLVCVQLSYF